MGFLRVVERRCEDAELELREAGEACELTSGRVFLDRASVAAAADVAPRGLGVFTYFVNALRAGERSVGELVARLRSSQPSVSKHLRTLREAGLVSVRVDAQRRIYRLNPGGLREVDEWLARGGW